MHKQAVKLDRRTVVQRLGTSITCKIMGNSLAVAVAQRLSGRQRSPGWRTLRCARSVDQAPTFSTSQ